MRSDGNWKLDKDESKKKVEVDSELAKILVLNRLSSLSALSLRPHQTSTPAIKIHRAQFLKSRLFARSTTTTSIAAPNSSLFIQDASQEEG